MSRSPTNHPFCPFPDDPTAGSIPPESVEPLVRIANKRQTHLRHMLLPQRVDLRAVRRRMIGLVDFIGGEIGDIDVGVEARFKGRADFAEAVPGDAAEEVVGLDLRGAVVAGGGAEAVGGGAEETVVVFVSD